MTEQRSVAVFADVDGVLTRNPINMDIARDLGADIERKLKGIEKAFYGGGTNDVFNAEFVPLFRSANFTKTKAEQCYNTVTLRGNVGRLLKHPGADVYLVSSGPSYYIELLAMQNDIAPERCKCSQYDFNPDGTLRDAVDAVGSAAKAAFVAEHAWKYKTSVGIGNSTTLDASFLARCDVPVMFCDRSNPDYLSVSDLEPVISLIDYLSGLDRQT
jgi:hypothetical protein